MQNNGGSLPIRIVGQDSGAEVSVAFSVVSTKPWLQLTTYSGPPGSPVGFSGGGWAAGERVSIHQGSDSGPVVAEGTADESGWLQPGASSAATGTAANPGDDATQMVTFVAVGDQSHGSASATFTVVNPFVGVPPNVPPPNPP
jgi:hypothetical protein